MKRKICDPCHEKEVTKNVRYNLETSEESEDTTTQTLDDYKIDFSINEGRTDQQTRTAPFKGFP
jgi:hypothetical protein